MKYLMLFLLFPSLYTMADKVDISSHMKHSSMQEMTESSSLIANVTVEATTGEHTVFYIGQGGEFTETYILHLVTVNKVIKGYRGPRQGSLVPIVHGDRIYVHQNGRLKKGLHFRGVPRLEAGNEYRLYLHDMHMTEETTGAPIYSVAGKNDGLFKKEGSNISRHAMNTSTIN